MQSQMKKIFLFFLLLTSVHVNAITVDDFFLSMPDSLLPYLKAEKREQLIKFAEPVVGEKNIVQNDMGADTWLEFRSDRVIKLHVSDATTMEFCKVVQGNDTLFCFIKTDYATEPESFLYIYNKVWELQDKIDVAKFWRSDLDDSVSEERKSELMALMEFPMYSATVDENDAEMLIVSRSLPLLSKEEKQKFDGVEMQTKVKIINILHK